jgi:SAM-dependent methyltransferase
MLREHNYKPFSGRLLSIGRQTVYLTLPQALSLVERECGRVRQDYKFEIDSQTRGAQGQDFITDRCFYSMFSDVAYSSLDVSAYEGADLVWDLCQPIPDTLEGRYDLIFNGSCMDNLFDPATAIMNMSRLLKPTGRVVLTEYTTRIHHAYLAYSFAWFHDYYAINEFVDCKVYAGLAEDHGEHGWNVYLYSPIVMQDGKPEFMDQDQWYDPRWTSFAIVIAEKGHGSTWNRKPVQFGYRSNDDDFQNQIYFRSATRFNNSSRPVLAFGGDIPPQHPQYRPCGWLDSPE